MKNGEREIFLDAVSNIDITYEIDGKERVGTNITEEGKIYGIFNDSTQVILGQISIAKFARPTNINMIANNLYSTDLFDFDGYDGVGNRIFFINGKMKKVSKKKANEVNEEFLKIKEKNYTLSVQNSSKDYYFVLKNLDGNLVYTKNLLELYGVFNVDNSTGLGIVIPFNEDWFPDYFVDKNQNKLMVYKAYKGTNIINFDEMVSFNATEYINSNTTNIFIKNDGKIYALLYGGGEKVLAQIVMSSSNTGVEEVNEYITFKVSK